MARPIDFAAMFRALVARRLRDRPGLDEEEAERLAESFYAEWSETPDGHLDGLSPRQWFRRLTAPREMVECLEDYARAQVEIPDLLLERIAGEPAAAPLLEALAVDAAREGKARTAALELLLEMAPERAQQLAADIVLAAEEGDGLAERAAEALSETAGPTLRERLLDGYAGTGEFARTLISEILCNFPSDNRIYRLMRDMLVNEPERRAFAARLLGRLGDERAIEPLRALFSLSDLTYFEYLEIRNAIEALGGEVTEERDFYGDPDYEYMRGLE